MRIVLDTNQLVAALLRPPEKVIAAAIYGLADFILTADKDLVAPEVKAVLEQMGIAVTTGAILIQLLDSVGSE